jgi:polyisoprenoid-binding protein YceI
VAYKLVHKFHTVTGTCRQVEGKARIAPDGSVQVQVRALTACFDSGNANRDAHMKEAVDAARFPYVEIKATAAAGSVGATAGQVEVPLQGRISLHGVEQPFSATFKASFSSPERTTVAGAFPISLESFQIERPQLLLVKVDDKVVIQASFELTQEPVHG